MVVEEYYLAGRFVHEDQNMGSEIHCKCQFVYLEVNKLSSNYIVVLSLGGKKVPGHYSFNDIFMA